MGTPHAPSDFQRVFEEATVSSTALVNSIISQPDYWLQNLTALQQAYSNLSTLNVEFTEKISTIEGVDEELANARESAARAHEALNQALTEHLRLMRIHPTTTSHTLTARTSPNHPDPDKYSTKLEAFITQLRIKLQRNTDHYIRPRQDTEQNRLSNAISRLEGDAFLQVEPFVSRSGIDLRDIAA